MMHLWPFAFLQYRERSDQIRAGRLNHEVTKLELIFTTAIIQRFGTLCFCAFVVKSPSHEVASLAILEASLGIEIVGV